MSICLINTVWAHLPWGRAGYKCDKSIILHSQKSSCPNASRVLQMPKTHTEDCAICENPLFLLSCVSRVQKPQSRRLVFTLKSASSHGIPAMEFSHSCRKFRVKSILKICSWDHPIQKEKALLIVKSKSSICTTKYRWISKAVSRKDLLGVRGELQQTLYKQNKLWVLNATGDGYWLLCVTHRNYAFCKPRYSFENHYRNRKRGVKEWKEVACGLSGRNSHLESWEEGRI